MSHQNFKDDTEIAELARAFEACEIHPAEFRHYQHLAVALWYVAHLPLDIACEKMKRGIQVLAASYGKTGYHETITEFWLRKVSQFRSNAENSRSLSEQANQLVEKYGSKNLIFDYYSRDLLASTEAKDRWVEPDLKSIDFREG